MEERNKKGKLVVLALLGGAVAVLGVQFARAFTGPTNSPGVGSGAIGVDANQNLSVGTPTPVAGTKLLIVAPNTPPAVGLEVRRADGTTPVLVVEEGGEVGIGIANPLYTLHVNGSIFGDFQGTIPADNVDPGVFGASGLGGNYGFPARLGVNIGLVGDPGALPADFYVNGTLQASIATFTGRVLVPGGSAGQPSFSFSNDSDTGIYSSNLDSLNFSAGGIGTISMKRAGTGATFLTQLNFSSGGIQGPGGIYPALEFGVNGGGVWSPVAQSIALTTGAADSAVERVRITQNGVGIGTTSPFYKLDINGPLRLMPTSTIPSLSDGVIYYNSSAGKFRCAEAGVWQNCVGGAGGGISGGGTQNYVSKFNTVAGTSIGDSIIFDSGTRVGVGTSTPATALHVYSQIGNAETRIQSNTDNDIVLGLRAPSQYWGIINTPSTGLFRIRSETAGADRLVVDSSGNVGIGITNPGAKLEVGGAAIINGTLKIVDGNQQPGRILTSDASGVGTWQPLPAGTPAFCNSVDTGGVSSDISLQGYYTLSMLIGGRNICEDNGGCTYRIWKYTSKKPDGSDLYDNYPILFKQGNPSSGPHGWIDAKGNDTGDNGNAVESSLGVSAIFTNLGVWDDVSGIETDANTLTLRDLTGTAGFVMDMCDF